MRAVGKVEDPKHSHVRDHGLFVAAEGAVKPAFSKLRFAFRQGVNIERIAFNDVDNFNDQPIRFGEIIRLNEIEVIRRRVVLWYFSKLTALQKSNR